MSRFGAYTQARLSVLPGLHWQSWDFPSSTQSLESLCQSIPEHQCYIGSPKIVLGLPTPLAPPVSEYPSTLQLHWQCRDYPGTTNSLVPLHDSVPEHRQSP